MKHLRTPTGYSPPGGFCFAAVWFALGVYALIIGRSLGDAFLGFLICFAFSFGIVYMGLTVPLWIEIGDHLVYRNLLHGIQTYEWAEVMAVDIEYGMDVEDELVITLANGKKLEMQRQSKDEIGALHIDPIH